MNKTPHNNKDELKVAFTNLNKEVVGTSCRRFRSRLEAVIEANGDFFLIDLTNSISRYFVEILVSISDKVRCMCYFPFGVI